MAYSLVQLVFVNRPIVLLIMDPSLTGNNIEYCIMFCPKAQVGVMVTVFGFGYLAVPLYRLFCQMTGIAGDVQVKNESLLQELSTKRDAGM